MPNHPSGVQLVRISIFLWPPLAAISKPVALIRYYWGCTVYTIDDWSVNILCLQSVVMEGKYWKRQLDICTAEYKKWRVYYMKKIMPQTQAKMGVSLLSLLGNLSSCRDYKLDTSRL